MSNIKSLDALNKYVSGNLGKNLLINGDKSVSQRGDFVAQSVAGNSYTVDRDQMLSAGNAAVTIDWVAYDSEIRSRSIKYTSIATTTYIHHLQEVEDYVPLRDQVLTLAMVKSDLPINLRAALGTSTIDSQPSLGDGTWERLTLTFTVDSGATQVRALVTTQASGGTTVGQYFQVGQEQLELGDTATDFEVVDPATQLARCQRYFVSQGNKSDSSHSYYRFATGKFDAASDLQCAIPFSQEMRISPVVGYTGNFIAECSLGAVVVTNITNANGGLFADTASGVNNEIGNLYANNDMTSRIFYDSEIY